MVKSHDLKKGGGKRVGCPKKMRFSPAFKMLGVGLSLNGAERGERAENASVLNKTCAEKYSANSCISVCPLLHLPPPVSGGYIQKKYLTEDIDFY